MLKREIIVLNISIGKILNAKLKFESLSSGFNFDSLIIYFNKNIIYYIEVRMR